MAMPTCFKRIKKMAKKYFIRKSHAELVQEQNQLLEILLAKQDEKLQVPKITQQDDITTPLSDPPTEDVLFEFEEKEEELPYIPTNSKSSAKLFVKSDQINLDETAVQKLKTAKKNPTNKNMADPLGKSVRSLIFK